MTPGWMRCCQLVCMPHLLLTGLVHMRSTESDTASGTPGGGTSSAAMEQDSKAASPTSPGSPGSHLSSDHANFGGGAGMPRTVKEAVAIAAGKKGMGISDHQSRKQPFSRSLCLLYWFLVVMILSLITFTIWLSVQLARRQRNALNDSSGEYTPHAAAHNK